MRAYNRGRDDLAALAVVSACCADCGVSSGGCVSEGRDGSSGCRRKWQNREPWWWLVPLWGPATGTWHVRFATQGSLRSPVPVDGGGSAHGAGALLPERPCRLLGVVGNRRERLFRGCSSAGHLDADTQADVLCIRADRLAKPHLAGRALHGAVEPVGCDRTCPVANACGATCPRVAMPVAATCSMARASGSQSAKFSLPPAQRSLDKRTALPDAAQRRLDAAHRLVAEAGRLGQCSGMTPEPCGVACDKEKGE
jgi:hypothetical protein